MALQISSVVLLAFLRVMARFLERLASSRVILFTALWATLFVVLERSTVATWALVLNSSSNLSRSSSYRRESLIKLAKSIILHIGTQRCAAVRCSPAGFSSTYL